MFTGEDRPYERLRDAPVPDRRVATIKRFGLDSREGGRAFSSMHAGYTRAISRLCRSVLGEAFPDPQLTAQEVVQDTWFAASEGLVTSFRQQDPVSPWLAVIARRRSLDAIDKQLAQSRAGDLFAIELSALADSSFAPTSTDDTAHALIEALDVLDRLPATRHELYHDILLSQGFGETQEELAATYGVPLPTMKSQVQSARRAVDAYVAESGIIIPPSAESS